MWGISRLLLSTLPSCSSPSNGLPVYPPHNKPLLKTLTTSSSPPLTLITTSAGTTWLIREGYRMYSLHKTCVLSFSGEGLLERSRLEFMRQLTHWYSLFPIDFTSVIPYLCKVQDTPDLCLNLGSPLCFLHTLEEDYPRSIERSWLKWMSSTYVGGVLQMYWRR